MAIGLGLSILLGKGLSFILFGVEAADGSVLVGVAALLSLTALVAVSSARSTRHQGRSHGGDTRGVIARVHGSTACEPCTHATAPYRPPTVAPVSCESADKVVWAALSPSLKS